MLARGPLTDCCRTVALPLTDQLCQSYWHVKGPFLCACCDRLSSNVFFTFRLERVTNLSRFLVFFVRDRFSKLFV